MVEVDATVLIMASAGVLGLAVMVVACGLSSKEKDTSSGRERPSTTTEATAKKRKSKRAAPKTKATSESEPDDIDSAPPAPEVAAAPVKKLPAVVVVEEKKPAAKAEAVKEAKQPAAAPSSKEPVSPLPVAPTAHSIEPPSKKSKETAEQKAARMERQKTIVKAPEEPVPAIFVESVPVSAPVPTVSSTAPLASASAAPDSGSSAGDGWAVVGKVKAKKSRADEQAVVEAAKGVSPPPAVDMERMVVSVDAKKLGSIIGPKGATLHSIQDLTGTEINTPKDRDATGLVEVTIVGASLEGVQRAAQAVSDLARKGYAALLQGEDFSEGHVSVHPMYLPEVIGKGGCCIKAIQDHFGVKLSVPQGVARDETSNVKIGIAGAMDKVSAAKATIKEIAHYYHSVVTHPSIVHEEMEDVPASTYNLIIGPKGSEIKHIQANFKVSVHIPNVNSICKNVLVVGLEKGVETACAYIRKIVNQSSKDETAASEAFFSADVETSHEAWMDQYTHPSAREVSDESSPVVTAPRSAWGSAVAYAEGW